jgi:hypothetical protein
VTSVMGLLEEREAAARVRVEELPAEADRILSELAAAKAMLERRAIARVEPAEALAAPGDAAVQEAPEPVPEAKAVKALIGAWQDSCHPIVFVRHDSPKADSPLRPWYPGNDSLFSAPGHAITLHCGRRASREPRQAIPGPPRHPPGLVVVCR